MSAVGALARDLKIISLFNECLIIHTRDCLVTWINQVVLASWIADWEGTSP